MKLLPVSVLSPLAMALSVHAVVAHHSFTSTYDPKQEVSVQGVVREFRFVNPHAMMSIDVTDQAGKVVTWTVEFAGRLMLTGGGWTDRTIAAGERVIVSGNPSHTGAPRMYFRKLVRADGAELLTPTSERLNAVEEQRRQRALQRNQPQ